MEKQQELAVSHWKASEGAGCKWEHSPHPRDGDFMHRAACQDLCVPGEELSHPKDFVIRAHEIFEIFLKP